MIIFTDIDGTLFNNEHRAEFIPQDKSHTDSWRYTNKKITNQEVKKVIKTNQDPLARLSTSHHSA